MESGYLSGQIQDNGNIFITCSVHQWLEVGRLNTKRKEDLLHMKELRSLSSEVDLVLKQIDKSVFSQDGIEIFKMCFGGFLDFKMPSGELVLTSRRFAGDSSLPGGSYYTIACEDSGDDKRTLFGELLAYASHGYDDAGYFKFWDLTIPEQRKNVSQIIPKRIRQGLIDPTLESPGIIVGLMPFNGHPHPFVHRRTGKMGPGFVDYTICVQKYRATNVIDLRTPSTADAFCKILTSPPYYPKGRTLDSFRDLLPSILNQELGGGPGFCTIAGTALRNAGIHGLIYPSARSDAYVKVHNGTVVDSSGWIFVKYDETVSPPALTLEALLLDLDPLQPKIIKAKE